MAAGTPKVAMELRGLQLPLSCLEAGLRSSSPNVLSCIGSASHQEVALLVQSQVVGTGEAALTVGALKRFDACVLAEVSRQFVRAGKLPCAALPHALVGLLACRERGQAGEYVPPSVLNTSPCGGSFRSTGPATHCHYHVKK